MDQSNILNVLSLIQQTGYTLYEVWINMKWIHVILFPTSWLLFYLIGKLYFEISLGQYHATHSHSKGLLCKSLFLLSFVTACTIFEVDYILYKFIFYITII